LPLGEEGEEEKEEEEEEVFVLSFPPTFAVRRSCQPAGSCS
jgi:hypothetical protein